MAVVSIKATAITNADASPRVLNNGTISGGIMRQSVGTIETNNGDDIGSKYFFARVRSSDRVEAVRLYCDAVTSGTMDVGLYRTTADGGAVVDVDFFASAQAISSAILTGTDITYEANSAAANVSRIEQPLWQALGLTSDPGVDYDIVGTLTAATAAAATVSLKVNFVNNA